MSKVPALFVLMLAIPTLCDAGQRVQIEPGATFEKPDEWVLVSGEALQGLQATVAQSGQALAKHDDIVSIARGGAQASTTKIGVAKYPLGTRRNVIVIFDKVDISHIDLSHLSGTPNFSELLLQAFVIAAAEGLQEASPTSKLEGPEKLEINGREWWKIEVSAEISVYTQEFERDIHGYYTLLGKGAVLTVTASAEPGALQQEQAAIRSIVESLKVEE